MTTSGYGSGGSPSNCIFYLSDPHFHSLILEGGFDSKGPFYFLPIHDTARLAQLLRQRTVGMFLQLGLIRTRACGAPPISSPVR